MGSMGPRWILGAVPIAALVWALLESTRGPMNGRAPAGQAHSRAMTDSLRVSRLSLERTE